MTGEEVCDCDDVVPPLGTGFTITHSCKIVDIDECRTNHGGCHVRADCINHDATKGHLFHMCVCHAGWHGDGRKTCDYNQYTTSFRIYTVDFQEIDDLALLDHLSDSGVLPRGLYTYQMSVVKTPTF